MVSNWQGFPVVSKEKREYEIRSCMSSGVEDASAILLVAGTRSTPYLLRSSVQRACLKHRWMPRKLVTRKAKTVADKMSVCPVQAQISPHDALANGTGALANGTGAERNESASLQQEEVEESSPPESAATISTASEDATGKLLCLLLGSPRG